MRLFTAIDVPADVTGKLRALLDQLRPAAKLSWTSIEKMHITTKFIGEWPEDRLEEMRRTLAGIRLPGGVQIAVRGLGWYPNPRNPRVFWAGIDGGEELRSLARATDDSVHGIGVAAEGREYSPHLTLARIRERVPLDGLRTAVDALESTDFGSFHATAFYLYLSRAGAYSKLSEFALP